MQYDFAYKVLIIGNSSVGKSSLLTKFTDQVFNESFLPTIGVDFKIKNLQCQGSKVKLQIWDTAGQEKFRSILTSYYKGVHGVLIVFDVTDRASFNDTIGWLQEVEKHGRQDCVKILIGNKSDLASQRRVSYEQAEKLAESQAMKYIQASVKDGRNVEQSFLNLIKQMRVQIKPLPSKNMPKPPVCLLNEATKNPMKYKMCC